MKEQCYFIVAGILTLVISIGCDHKAQSHVGKVEESFVKKQILSLIVQSNGFTDRTVIPKKYTCDGEDISPDLYWDDPPSGVESFVIICDDPDAPGGNWVHWILYDGPPDLRSLPEAIEDLPLLPDGAFQGRNDFDRIGYNGPCPPPGKPHRYRYKVYAVDKKTGLPPGATKNDVLKEIKGHILSKGVLIGTYQRSD